MPGWFCIQDSDTLIGEWAWSSWHSIFNMITNFPVLPPVPMPCVCMRVPNSEPSALLSTLALGWCNLWPILFLGRVETQLLPPFSLPSWALAGSVDPLRLGCDLGWEILYLHGSDLAGVSCPANTSAHSIAKLSVYVTLPPKVPSISGTKIISRE